MFNIKGMELVSVSGCPTPSRYLGYILAMEKLGYDMVQVSWDGIGMCASGQVTSGFVPRRMEDEEPYHVLTIAHT